MSGSGKKCCGMRVVWVLCKGVRRIGVSKCERRSECTVRGVKEEREREAVKEFKGESQFPFPPDFCLIPVLASWSQGPLQCATEGHHGFVIWSWKKVLVCPIESTSTERPTKTRWIYIRSFVNSFLSGSFYIKFSCLSVLCAGGAALCVFFCLIRLSDLLPSSELKEKRIWLGMIPTRVSLRLNGFKSSEFSLVAACLLA